MQVLSNQQIPYQALIQIPKDTVKESFKETEDKEIWCPSEARPPSQSCPPSLLQLPQGYSCPGKEKKKNKTQPVHGFAFHAKGHGKNFNLPGHLQSWQKIKIFWFTGVDFLLNAFQTKLYDSLFCELSCLYSLIKYYVLRCFTRQHDSFE